MYDEFVISCVHVVLMIWFPDSLSLCLDLHVIAVVQFHAHASKAAGR